MSLFGDQADRLIRKKWHDVNQLASELYAMFLSDDGVTATGPVALQKPAGSTYNFTGGTIGDFTVGGSTVTNGPTTFNSSFQFDPSQTIVTDSSGGTTFQGGGFTSTIGGITFNDYLQQQADKAIDSRFPGGGGGTAVNPVFLGKIVSGSGQVYQVSLYPGGPDQAPGDPVSVRFPMLVAAETLDPGTWAHVFEYDSVQRDPLGNILLDGAGKPIVDRTYAGFVPTWLDGPP